MDCDKDIDYYSTRNMMKKWGSFDVTTVVSYFNKERIGPETYNRRTHFIESFFSVGKEEKAGF
jgi:hypothetical protein